uniref:Uncharacterized protein n=1 Tax=Candidatus Kentrum sp. TC TaxID=2126339 RepID=A0A450YEV6_9GAMM|nr:MAG: hypothetical protein BECKTC1821E_GA0114239_100667 [Candidatus Kentron sp. TC]
MAAAGSGLASTSVFSIRFGLPNASMAAVNFRILSGMDCLESPCG